MKSFTFAAVLLGAAVTGQAQPAVISSGHIDLGIAFEDGAFDLHIHDETSGMEYAPDEAILRVGANAHAVVPNDARFGFLGTAGASIWILPQNPDPHLPFLGIAAEEVESGLFAGDFLTLTLKGVNGPGDFILYRTSGILGNPTIAMNSRDGISDETDSTIAPVGAHTDYNWAFTAPGNYTLTFEAGGTLAGEDAPIASGPVDYTFQVIPEPGTASLIAFGLVSLVCLRGGRRK